MKSRRRARLTRMNSTKPVSWMATKSMKVIFLSCYFTSQTNKKKSFLLRKLLIFMHFQSVSALSVVNSRLKKLLWVWRLEAKLSKWANPHFRPCPPPRPWLYVYNNSTLAFFLPFVCSGGRRWGGSFAPSVGKSLESRNSQTESKSNFRFRQRTLSMEWQTSHRQTKEQRNGAS